MTRVLITGGAGFIGAHLAARLVEEGARVGLVDDFSRGVRDRDLERLLARPGVDMIGADLLRPDALSGLDRGYELIFHLAAVVGVENVMRSPYRVLDGNVRMLSCALDFAARQRALRRLVFASTSEVYAGSLGTADFVLPTPESVAIRLPDLVQPRSSYLLSKLYGEALCRHSGVPFTIVRPHNIYGPRMGTAHVIPQLIERIWDTPAGGRLEVFSPSHTRAFCHVSDAVEMALRLAHGEAGRNGLFNLGSQSEEIAMRDLARRLVELTGRPVALADGPDTQGSPLRRCPDMTQTLRATRFEPAVTLAEGLADTLGWYLKSRRQGRDMVAA